jgi:large subunit ribosomal protein L5
MSKKDDKGAKDKGAKKDKGAQQPKGGKPAKGDKKGAQAKGDKGAKAAKPAEPEVPEEIPEPRLRDKYNKQVVPHLMKRFAYKNPMQVPRLQRITINVGLGDAVQNPKLLDAAVDEVAAIAGQKPIITRARKSIASFKLREGMPIGVTVTLRRERMWEFFDRLVSVGLPRVRDFRGISPRAFDGAGNYTLGLKEQIVFPEINFDKVDHVHGMNITFVTSAKTNEEAKEMLGMLGMPFRS